MRIPFLLLTAACALAPRASAQSASTAPLVLLLPPSARATAMGNAWVAGRDEYAVFYNPALIAPVVGAPASLTRYGNGTFAALTSATTVNWLNLGWGVEVVKFSVRNSAPYPLAPAELVRGGSRDALSLALSAGGSFLYKKGFRTGVGVKYAEDRLGSTSGFGLPSVTRGFFLADVGVSHAFLSGTVGLTVQHIGDPSRANPPMQETLGWARQMQAKQLDLGFAAQVTERNGSVYAGGGVEAGYGWIEGWSAALRAGARRMETPAQRPMSFGGTLNADHLALDYALEFFEGSRYAHHVSIRWR